MRRKPIAALVQVVEHLLGAGTIANCVEYFFEVLVVLSENLAEFESLERIFSPNMRVKEPGALVVLAHVGALFAIARHRRELIRVAEHHNLSTAEWQLASPAGNAQGARHGIHQIGVDH